MSKLCPSCNEPMIKLDTKSFTSSSMMVQLFAFQHTAWGCENCNKVIPIKKED